MSKVASVITHAVNRSPKTQKEIAREVGFPHGNVISMIKSGETKLPLSRARSMAQAIGLPAAELVRMCLQEYWPEVWRVIEESLPGALLADHEVEVIEVIRRHFDAKSSA